VLVTKNGETRHVPMNEAALSAFKTLFGKSKGTGPVFLNSRGEHRNSPKNWFVPAVKKAKVEGFTWHCLRHTFASRLVMTGVGLRQVQELMGHKTIQMTCRYAHLSPAVQLEAVEKLGHFSDAVGQKVKGMPEETGGTRTDTSTSEQVEDELLYAL
jgi:integrase